MKAGVRLKAEKGFPPGNLHAVDPATIQRRTRCGIRVNAAAMDRWETGVPVDTVDPDRRCAKCFPGTGRRS